MKPFPTEIIRGVSVSCVNIKEAVEACLRRIGEPAPGYVCVTGVHGVYESSSQSGLRDLINASWLNVPDGMPLVWVMRFRGRSSVGRVYGPEFMLRIINEGRKREATHFLLGGGEGIAARLAGTLQTRFPGTKVVGHQTPPFRAYSDQEITELCSRLNEISPDFIWIGISTPKQELLMSRLLPKLRRGVLIGVGAAFDFNSGNKIDAPVWIRNTGFQWLYRFFQEPKRLWARYSRIVPYFLPVLIKEGLSWFSRQLKCRF